MYLYRFDAKSAAAMALVGLMAAAGAHAATFDGLDVSLAGTAAITSGGNLLLTPSAIGGVGAAWLNTPVSTTAAFSTTFNFSLTNVGGIGNADGLAFVFQNTGTSALGSGGGNLGVDIPDNTTSGGSVAAEFQSFWNTYGVVQNTDATAGPFTNSQSLNAPDDVSQASSITGTETVAYDAVAHQVTQTLSIDYVGPSGPVHLDRTATGMFNLITLFGPTMTVGLSAATGAGSTDQAITSWTVSAVPEPGEWALLFAGLGIVGMASRRRMGAVA